MWLTSQAIRGLECPLFGDMDDIAVAWIDGMTGRVELGQAQTTAPRRWLGSSATGWKERKGKREDSNGEDIEVGVNLMYLWALTEVGINLMCLWALTRPA